MRIETPYPIGQALRQRGPVPVRRALVKSRIKRLGVATIRIDQTGKQHPDCDKEIKATSGWPHQRPEFRPDRRKIGPGRAAVGARRNSNFPPCGRVIDPDVFTAQHAVKGRIVFSEIMKQPRHAGRVPQSKRIPASRGQLRCRGQVIGQQLPVAAILHIAAMGVKQRHPSAALRSRTVRIDGSARLAAFRTRPRRCVVT